VIFGIRVFSKRPIDFAQRPQRERQIGHCPDAGVVPEAKSLIGAPLGIE